MEERIKQLEQRLEELENQRFAQQLAMDELEKELRRWQDYFEKLYAPNWGYPLIQPQPGVTYIPTTVTVTCGTGTAASATWPIGSLSTWKVLGDDNDKEG